MIQTIKDQIYNKIKNNIGFDRSKKHLKWVKEKHPYCEPHHLFGSYTSKKTSDYAVIPVTRAEHEYAEKHKSEFAIENLHKLINILIQRIKELEG